MELEQMHLVWSGNGGRIKASHSVVCTKYDRGQVC